MLRKRSRERVTYAFIKGKLTLKLGNLVSILLAMAVTASAVWAQGQAAPLTEGAPSQPSQKAAYHYGLPLTLALEAAKIMPVIAMTINNSRSKTPTPD